MGPPARHAYWLPAAAFALLLGPPLTIALLAYTGEAWLPPAVVAAVTYVLARRGRTPVGGSVALALGAVAVAALLLAAATSSST